MATDRLIREVETHDVPKISLGNFSWQPVDRAPALLARAPATSDPSAPKRSIAEQLLMHPEVANKPAEPLGDDVFPLNKLEDRTFAGTGYNVIWRPRGEKNPQVEDDGGKARDVLELNLTAETMAFSKSLGDVPNRGKRPEKDLLLKGISYVQRVGAFENDKTGLNDAELPKAIHFEPGVFMFVPASNKISVATINRMASIPHGTTINAQGIAPKVPPVANSSSANQPKNPAVPTFAVESIIPIDIETKTNVDFLQLRFPGDKDKQSDRLPNPLTNFEST